MVPLSFGRRREEHSKWRWWFCAFFVLICTPTFRAEIEKESYLLQDKLNTNLLSWICTYRVNSAVFGYLPGSIFHNLERPWNGNSTIYNFQIWSTSKSSHRVCGSHLTNCAFKFLRFLCMNLKSRHNGVRSGMVILPPRMVIPKIAAAASHQFAILFLEKRLRRLECGI